MARITIQDPEKAARIVRDAGGKVIGRTRLQKIAYLLEVTSLGEGFSFEYRHYGPYSEQLADAVSTASVFGVIKEEERPTNWGGSYSIFTCSLVTPTNENSLRSQLISTASNADPIALELAATAIFLATHGEGNPWEETARRKPEKASRIDKAKQLYADLKLIQTPVALPTISSKTLTAGASWTS